MLGRLAWQYTVAHLGCTVDLVTDKALRPELRPFVERDRVHV